MVQVSNELPEKLKQLRSYKGWSKTEVQRRLGLKTMSTYANWEYGVRQPDNDTLIKLANLFDVSTDYLLGQTDISDPVDELAQDLKKALADPEFKRWMTDVSESNEEDLEKLKKMWNIIKNND